MDFFIVGLIIFFVLALVLTPIFYLIDKNTKKIDFGDNFVNFLIIFNSIFSNPFNLGAALIILAKLSSINDGVFEINGASFTVILYLFLVFIVAVVKLYLWLFFTKRGYKINIKLLVKYSKRYLFCLPCILFLFIVIPYFYKNEVGSAFEMLMLFIVIASATCVGILYMYILKKSVFKLEEIKF